MKKISAIGILGLVVIAAPLLAFAQAGAGTPPVVVNPPPTPGPITSGAGIINFINQILGWAATAFWILAALFIFYAAFLYLTAAGDPEKVGTASRNLLYAVIAIVIGLMAYGLPLLVTNVLGGR